MMILCVLLYVEKLCVDFLNDSVCVCVCDESPKI